MYILLGKGSSFMLNPNDATVKFWGKPITIPKIQTKAHHTENTPGLSHSSYMVQPTIGL